MDTTITTLEMCAGYGGIGLGIKNIFGERLRTIAYCELEGFAQANLISKMEAGLLDAAPIWSDLKTFPYESFHGLVDILIAGYPCQPFSAAGKRAGKDDPRHLWPWIADGIRLLRPRLCFFENVEGHISLGLSTVISDLEELGYKVSWGIFSASECLDASGRTAPHQRKRVFIMAHRSGERLQGGKWCWKTRAQGESSGHFAECGSSMADSIMRGMSRSRNELGDSCEAGQGGENPSQNSNDGNKEFMANSTNWRGKGVHDWNTKSEDVVSCRAWPSRPGQQQYAWEPPRVVGGLAHTGSLGRRGRSDGDEGGLRGEIQVEGSCGSGAEEAMGDSTSDGRQHDKQPKEGRWAATVAESSQCELGYSTSERPHRGGEDGLGLQPEMLGEGYEAMGNADHGRLASGLNAGSGAEADRGGQGDIEQAESGQAQPPLGRDAYEPPIGMDLSELSGISHKELAEIREWMVKTESRTDELRLLGNGVVPATAERAFLTLIEELNK